ncbi:MAG: ADP-ribosylglycohydrolase family protein [Treponema sp.]|nr:ADP-ribosylglycohydrolase family protein [Treponema sp.]
MQIEYESYLDKVLGCWIGKCISGTIGAPFEGRKELFNYRFDKRSIEKMLPNDDLDLQVLWLHVIEEKGIYFRTGDLADAFLDKCPYSPGEYAIFKKNYRKGIHPPYSGFFNNSYYLNGNGCPIRSEIWGCITPGNPRLAASYAWKDGIMDHGDESVYAEAFFAALESAAFFESDIKTLVNRGLEQISPRSKIYRMIKDVLDWSARYKDWREVRRLILDNYGHPDCTNTFQNTAFVVMALLFCNMDIIDSTMMGLNCGYDTDCTCATAGAVAGIVAGAEALREKYGFTDMGYVLGVNIKRDSDRLTDLAKAVCAVGVTIADEINRDVKITNTELVKRVPKTKKMNDMDISVEYCGLPSAGPGEKAQVSLHIKNNLSRTFTGTLELELPEGWSTDGSSRPLEVNGGCKEIINVEFFVSEKIGILYECNIITAKLLEKDKVFTEYRFGISGAAVWKLYGPFYDNYINLPDMNYWESYYPHIAGADKNDGMDKTRNYHLNFTSDMDKEYLPEPEPEKSNSVWRRVNTHTDRFCFSDLVKREGPGIIYLERLLYSPEDRQAGIQIGFTDPCKVWVNGELLMANDNHAWNTNENRHFYPAAIRKGGNRILVKLQRNGLDTTFTLVYSMNSATCATHFTDFGSIVPND